MQSNNKSRINIFVKEINYLRNLGTNVYKTIYQFWIVNIFKADNFKIIKNENKL